MVEIANACVNLFLTLLAYRRWRNYHITRYDIRNTPGVVHMPMCEQNMVYGNNLVGGLADIEADVQLRDRNHGLLARDRIADDFQIVYLDMC